MDRMRKAVARLLSRHRRLSRVWRSGWARLARAADRCRNSLALLKIMAYLQAVLLDTPKHALAIWMIGIIKQLWDERPPLL